MVVLEAMAAGVPVAAAAVGGVPELIRQGETGLLFDPSDREDMIGAVRELLTPRSFERAARAKEEAWERFLPEVIARQHLTIYEEVLSSGG
jgi:glycosyltransferase involved in cell wall biosynthesis